MAKRKRAGLRPVAGSATTDRSSVAPDERFWHRKHVVTLFWTIIAGLVGSAATVAYQHYQPPPTVFVANQDSLPRIVVVHDSAAARGLDTLIAEFRAMRRASRQRASRPTNPGGDTTRTNLANASGLSEIQIPPWRFSQSVKGYTQQALSGIARTSCPGGTAAPGAEVEAAFAFRTPKTATQVTPIFVDLSRRHSATSRTLLFSQQFAVSPTNRLQLQAPSDTGHFVLSVGVYFRADSVSPYPEQFTLECPIAVSR